MNPLLTVRTNQVPLHQLKSLCSRLHNSLSDPSASHKDKIKLEQLLWAEVKLLKTFNNQALLTYLIGFYHAILFQIAKQQPAIDDLLQYHLLIRLGDLNRYLQRDKQAIYYYSNARNLFPLFGHAYNQLGLTLAQPGALSHNYYKCCYYYARAVKSSDKSMSLIAESNLRIASRSNDNDILNHLLNNDSRHRPSASDDAGDISEGDELPMENGVRTYPDSATNWFYLVVVAIAVDNISPIASLFLSFMKDNFSTQRATVMRDNVKKISIHCDRNSYLLLATLDILLDWIKLSAHGTKILELVSGDLRRIRTCLQSTMASIKCESNLNQSSSTSKQSYPSKTSSFDVTNSSHGSNNNGSQSTLYDCPSSNLNTSNSSAGLSATSQKKALPALPHDHVLRGFKPLDTVHSEISFHNNYEVINLIHCKLFSEETMIKDVDDAVESAKLIDSEDLRQILLRITTKMDSFGGRIKKRSRNIALESILSNMS